EHPGAGWGVDVALDPFRYGAGGTTCDALWMGVAVVTLPGTSYASRHALSHLSGVGLTECAATDAEGYVALAARLAQDLECCAELRAELRDRMAQSPLCDGERCADELLGVLRGAWREWATGAGRTNPTPV